ncbi:MAG: ATP synthase F1 subunit delta [Bacteroidales bacterium]|nr:ATP synthase F1 subunit delta [Bacteroidales bacterium]
MQYSKANIRYARALYALAEEKKQGEDVYKDMCMLADFLAEAKQIRAWLASPVIPVAHKKKAVEMTLGQRIDSLSVRFLHLIVENNRSADVYGIVRSYVSLYRSKKGIVHVEVDTPHPLSEAEDRMFSDWFAQSLPGRKVEMSSRVVPSLLGGFTFKVGGRYIDKSVAGRLQRIRRNLGVDKTNG